VTVKISAGENWDEVVAKTVENNWSGLEFLSLIPGTAGAAPVQNIGAYGAEISDTLLRLKFLTRKRMNLAVQKRRIAALPTAPAILKPRKRPLHYYGNCAAA
jgi:UDP-N-acetylenolpyruvoylglucosamine reductase